MGQARGGIEKDKVDLSSTNVPLDPTLIPAHSPLTPQKIAGTDLRRHTRAGEAFPRAREQRLATALHLLKQKNHTYVRR